MQTKQTPTEVAAPTPEDVTADGTPSRMISRDELAAHDGSRFPELPLWLSLGGIVFDVTEGGTEFYGPKSSYRMFAGKVCGRALAIGSLEQEDIDRGEDVSDLTDRDLQEYIERAEFYKEKYVIVGRLIDDDQDALR
eukprot:FR738579.1.p1 GENE.FR738579.1~~FR738579.1.p1  ORF type:complete len:157 (+),score=5.17 FR738579.1:62-472(+)